MIGDKVDEQAITLAFEAQIHSPSTTCFVGRRQATASHPTV
jgi:hypothetical protein